MSDLQSLQQWLEQYPWLYTLLTATALLLTATIANWITKRILLRGLVRVGDWIEMPQLNADGDVIDVALHTVKVQNWDKTITTIPTKRLISDSFKNWRGMSESGGRRIKRSILLDQNSVHFLDNDERSAQRRFALLNDYLDQKERELAEWNAKLTQPDEVNHHLGHLRRHSGRHLRPPAGDPAGVRPACVSAAGRCRYAPAGQRRSQRASQ
jgi:hypothetical protein